MKQIDAAHNDGKLWATDDEARRDEWMEWVDLHMSKATIPILYGSLGSALKTTTRVSKLEKFGFISKRLYAWQVSRLCGESLQGSVSRKMEELRRNCGMIC